jgi:hypothetical protein
LRCAEVYPFQPQIWKRSGQAGILKDEVNGLKLFSTGRDKDKTRILDHYKSVSDSTGLPLVRYEL